MIRLTALLILLLMSGVGFGFNETGHFDSPFTIGSGDTLKPYTEEEAKNIPRELDKVYYYTAGYYSRWEAEDRSGDKTVGMLSDFGRNIDGGWASSIDDTSQAGLFLYGPLYAQDKSYRLYYMSDKIVYTTNFSIKLGTPIDTTEDNPLVCRLKIRYTYRLNGNTVSSVISQKDVYKNSLSSSGYSGNSEKTSIYYIYPDSLLSSANTNPFPFVFPDKPGVIITDDEPGLGIEFVVEWTKKYIIIVDNITVYDEDIWSSFMEDPLDVSAMLLNYCYFFPESHRNDVFNRGGISKPLSLDSYEPIRIVDSLLVSNGYITILTKPLQRPKIPLQSR